MKVSIIVPVYNVEAYLRKCVQSLLNQDLSPDDYEVILIDDGSTDSCGQLCDLYAANHDNIHVIHQRNSGLSAARNRGIAVAKGDYVQFVDSDDYLNPNILGTLVRQLESQDLDILRFNYQNVDLAGNVFEPNRYSKPFVDFSDGVCDGVTFLNERLGYACYACQFLVKSSIIHQDGYGFKEGIYFEDIEWTPRIILQAKRIASSEIVVYNYLFRTDSIARNTNIERKRKAIQDKLCIIDGFTNLRGLINNDSWFKGMSSQMVLTILYSISRYFYPERKNYFGVLKKKGVFPLSTYHTTPSAKRKIWLANFSPSLFCLFFHFKR